MLTRRRVPVRVEVRVRPEIVGRPLDGGVGDEQARELVLPLSSVGLAHGVLGESGLRAVEKAGG